MRIAAIDVALLEAGYLGSALFRRRIASPMSVFPDLAAERRSWMWPGEKVVTRIRDSDGVEGTSITSGGRIVATIVAEHLRRMLIGRSADDLGAAWDLSARSLLPFDRSGFAMMAVAAIDIALWDLRAARRGTRLRALLGHDGEKRLRHYVTTMDPSRSAWAEASGIKVPMPAGPADGAEGIAANVAAVAAARHAAGEARDVMLDAFMAWDVDYTLRMVEALLPYRVRWFEDPLPPDDLDAFARLKSRGGDAITLALGNFAFSRWDCKALLETGAVGVLQPDVAWAGGVTEALRIADLAVAHRVPVVLHNGAEQPWAIELSHALPCIDEVEHVDRDEGSLLAGLHVNSGGAGRAVLSPAVLDRLQPFAAQA